MEAGGKGGGRIQAGKEDFLLTSLFGGNLFCKAYALHMLGYRSLSIIFVLKLLVFC